MKTILITMALFIGQSVSAQKPNNAPFLYRGQTGMMAIDGSTYVEPGAFGTNHIDPGQQAWFNERIDNQYVWGRGGLGWILHFNKESMELKWEECG